MSYFCLLFLAGCIKRPDPYLGIINVWQSACTSIKQEQKQDRHRNIPPCGTYRAPEWNIQTEQLLFKHYRFTACINCWPEKKNHCLDTSRNKRKHHALICYDSDMSIWYINDIMTAIAAWHHSVTSGWSESDRMIRLDRMHVHWAVWSQSPLSFEFHLKVWHKLQSTKCVYFIIKSLLNATSVCSVFYWRKLHNK